MELKKKKQRKEVEKKEYEEMVECTFEPELNETYNSD